MRGGFGKEKERELNVCMGSMCPAFCFLRMSPERGQNRSPYLSLQTHEKKVLLTQWDWKTADSEMCRETRTGRLQSWRSSWGRKWQCGAHSRRQLETICLVPMGWSGVDRVSKFPWPSEREPRLFKRRTYKVSPSSREGSSPKEDSVWAAFAPMTSSLGLRGHSCVLHKGQTRWGLWKQAPPQCEG